MGRWDVTPLFFRLQRFEEGKGTATIHIYKVKILQWD
jgi:hypothetical protein